MAIVAGCAQAPGKSEKPVDPPVVEQPQKPVEQEKPEERDIVSIETYEVFVPEHEIGHLKGLEPFVIQTPIIKKEGQAYTSFNNLMEQEKSKYLNYIQYETDIEGTEILTKSYFATAGYHRNDDLLSIVIKEIMMGYGAGRANPQFLSYHFDVNEDIKLSQIELLERFDLNKDTANAVLVKQLEDLGYPACPPAAEADFDTYVDCYSIVYSVDVNRNYSVYLDENSTLYINDVGNLMVIISIETKTIPYYIEVQLS